MKLKNSMNLSKSMKIKFLTFLFIIISGIIYGQTDTIDLKTFEVIGIRAKENAPISKMTLKEKQIENHYYAQELPIFLNNTTNVTSSTDGGHNQGYVYFRLRGIDQTRINMTLNGIPLNELEDQGVYFSNYPDFISSLNTMQIQRGVGTSSNGVTSYGGSINFEAKQGFERYTKIDYGFGSFRTHRFSVENSTGMHKKFAFYTRYSHINTDGYKYHSGNRGYSFFLSGGYYGNKNVLKTIIFTGSIFNQLSWYAVPKDVIEIDPRTNYNTNRENDEFRQTLASLIWSHSINRESTITSTIFYNHLDGYWDFDLVPYDMDTVQRYLLNHDFYGFIFNYNLNQEDFEFNTGINLNGFKRNHSATYLPNTNKLYQNTGYKDEYSWFAKINYYIKRSILFFDAQVRNTIFQYDGDMSMNKLDWSFFNPKVGISFRFNEKHNLYTSLGTTSREPTRTDIFGGVDNPLEYYPVEPESVIDWELGYEFISNKTSLRTNLYYMDFKNEITLFGVLGENGLPLMTNVENSFRSGIETDLIIKLLEIKNYNISYNNNSAFTFNKILDNGRVFYPLYTPNLIINHWIVAENNLFKIILENKIQSKSYIDWENNYTTPSFYVINIEAGWKFYKDCLISLRYNNLTNKEYYTNGYVIGKDRYFFVNPPTNWFFNLSLKF
jgi:iron complex outermembrane recepter protein